MCLNRAMTFKHTKRGRQRVPGWVQGIRNTLSKGDRECKNKFAWDTFGFLCNISHLVYKMSLHVHGYTIYPQKN